MRLSAFDSRRAPNAGQEPGAERDAAARRDAAETLRACRNVAGILTARRYAAGEALIGRRVRKPVRARHATAVAAGVQHAPIKDVARHAQEADAPHAPAGVTRHAAEARAAQAELQVAAPRALVNLAGAVGHARGARSAAVLRKRAERGKGQEGGGPGHQRQGGRATLQRSPQHMERKTHPLQRKRRKTSRKRKRRKTIRVLVTEKISAGFD